METIKLLTSFSNLLDEKELSTFANKIDKVSFSLGKIVTAQFEGGIGYWIRNSRCWDNCYRQNRTKSPNKPTQEVWQSCWEEYKKSIGNDESGWEKYAEEDTIIKTASKEVKESFTNEIEKLVKKGMTVEAAISTIEYDKKNEVFDKIVEQAEILTKVASEIKDKKLSQELITITQELVKEAGIWSGLMGKGTNYQSAVGIFTQNAGNLLRNLDMAAKNPQMALKNKKKLLQIINVTFANLNKALPNAGFASRGIRDLNNNFIQQMTPIFNSIAQAQNVEQINSAVTNASSVVSDFSNKINNVKLPQTELQGQETEKELPQVLQPSSPIEVATDLINKGQYDEVIKMIQSNPDSANALKQWMSFSGIGSAKPAGNQIYSFNLSKNKKFAADPAKIWSQLGDSWDKPTTTTPTPAPISSAPIAIPVKFVGQIMNYIKQKMGPNFDNWIKKYTEEVSSVAAPEKQESDINQKFLMDIINQAARVVKNLPEEKRDEVSKKIEILKGVPDIIKSLQDLMGSTNKPGFTQFNSPTGQITTGLPEAQQI